MRILLRDTCIMQIGKYLVYGHQGHPHGEDQVSVGLVPLEEEQGGEKAGEDDADEEEHFVKLEVSREK